MHDLTAVPWASSPGSCAIRAADGAPLGGSLAGMMTTPELAAEAVDAHNASLAARLAAERVRRSGVTRMTGLTGVQIGDGGTQNNVF